MKKIIMKTQKLLLSCLILSIASPIYKAMAQGRQYNDWPMGPGMMGYGWGMNLFGMFFMIFFWVLVLVGLIFLVKWLIQITSGKKEIYSGSNKALEILKERYARGEIDKAEFENKKKDLQD